MSQRLPHRQPESHGAITFSHAASTRGVQVAGKPPVGTGFGTAASTGCTPGIGPSDWTACTRPDSVRTVSMAPDIVRTAGGSRGDPAERASPPASPCVLCRPRPGSPRTKKQRPLEATSRPTVEAAGGIGSQPSRATTAPAPRYHKRLTATRRWPPAPHTPCPSQHQDPEPSVPQAPELVKAQPASASSFRLGARAYSKTAYGRSAWIAT